MAEPTTTETPATTQARRHRERLERVEQSLERELQLAAGRYRSQNELIDTDLLKASLAKFKARDKVNAFDLARELDELCREALRGYGIRFSDDARADLMRELTSRKVNAQAAPALDDVE